jgi:hypothetical protein
MDNIDSKDLFSKKDTTIKSPIKRMVLSEQQFLAMNRDKVIKYFCQKWKEKNGIAYILPPTVSKTSFFKIFKPISQALATGYNVAVLNEAIDTYLNEEAEWFKDQGHPIRLFTEDIPRWVTKSKKVIEDKNKNIQVKAEQEEIRELNQKYGLIKKGDGWASEDGRFFVDLATAIRESEKKLANKTL